jgi:hypothetical protein
MATSTRICAVIWIIARCPARRAADSSSRAKRRHSNGCAFCCRRRIRTRSDTRECRPAWERPAPRIFGFRGARRPRLSAATRSRFSLPASRCSCWAVRFTPSWRAALIAADHNSSGIGAFPARAVLHSSNCVRTPSMPLLSSPAFFPIVLSSYKPKNDSSNCGPILHAHLPKGHAATDRDKDIGYSTRKPVRAASRASCAPSRRAFAARAPCRALRLRQDGWPYGA